MQRGQKITRYANYIWNKAGLVKVMTYSDSVVCAEDARLNEIAQHDRAMPADVRLELTTRRRQWRGADKIRHALDLVLRGGHGVGRVDADLKCCVL